MMRCAQCKKKIGMNVPTGILYLKHEDRGEYSEVVEYGLHKKCEDAYQNTGQDEDEDVD